MREDECKQTLIRMPLDVRRWVEEQVKRNASTLQAETVRSIRLRMELERRQELA